MPNDFQYPPTIFSNMGERAYRCNNDRIYTSPSPAPLARERCAFLEHQRTKMETAPRPPASRLEQALRSRRFVITAEITPPVSCNAQDLLEKALPLRGLVDAVNVTDRASARAHMSAPIAAVTLAPEALEPLLQLPPLDRNPLPHHG